MSEESFAERRRRLLVSGIAPSLLALLVAGHLWMLQRGNEAALEHYEAERWTQARNGFAGAPDLGVVSPWVSSFDAGTAAYRQGRFTEAAKLFQTALPDTPDDRLCDVRIDLALTYEAIAETAVTEQSRAAGQIALRDGRQALAGCSSTIDKRLGRKIAALDKETGSSQDQDLTEQEKQQELEKRNAEARKSRSRPLDPKNDPGVQIQW